MTSTEPDEFEAMRKEIHRLDVRCFKLEKAILMSTLIALKTSAAMNLSDAAEKSSAINDINRLVDQIGELFSQDEGNEDVG